MARVLGVQRPGGAAALLLAVTGLFLACPADPPEGSAELGPQGGVVRAADGVRVEVPAGALATPTVVTIEPVEATPPSSVGEAVGGAVRLGPSGLQFAVPVKVVLSWDPARLPAGASPGSLKIFSAPDGTEQFTSLGEAEVSGGEISSFTSHFSIFVPALPTPPAVQCQWGAGAGSSSGFCQHSAGCGEGFPYVMACQSGSCTCSVDGGVTGTTTANCTEPASIRSAFTGGCGFPDPGPLGGEDGGTGGTDGGAECSGGCGGNGSSCSCQADCGGHSYRVDCAAGTCTCTLDGATTGTASADCLSAGGVQEAYVVGCGFPDHFAIPDAGTVDAGTVDAGTADAGDCIEQEPSCAGGGTECGCDLTGCDGRGYSLGCSAGTCTCYIDGAPTGTTTANCADSASVTTAFKQGCGFP